jgi:hypothetical protein
MNRARLRFATTLLGVGLAAAAALAQSAPKAPELKPVLSGRKFEPPFKGQAEVEFTQPVVKRNKDMVRTTISVKNLAPAPLARLTIRETWFDRSGAIVSGNQGVLNTPLGSGEISTVTIDTPWKPQMFSNSWNFSHANGTVKTRKVKSLEPPKDAESAKE